MKRYWLVALLAVFLLPEGCIKDETNCGCEAPTRRTVTNFTGTLYYDSLHRQLAVYAYPTPGTIYFICSFNAQADSVYQQLTLPQDVVFSGAEKATCTKDVITTGAGVADIALTALSIR